MNEEEKKEIEDIKRTIELYELKPIDRISVEFDEFDYKIFKTILNLIEKQQTKIKLLEDDLYSVNCTINEYIEERNRLKNKMIGDKMEQFDDYIIYLIESYLEILGE